MRKLIEERYLHGSTVLHDHGLWLPINHLAATLGRSLGLPRVVSPHGMLKPWSLKHKRWKKKIAWWFYQKGDLSTAEVMIATSQEEADEIRNLGFANPVAVLPLGVDLPPIVQVKAEGRSPKTALFLSRLHPVKGLSNLVLAWAAIASPDWRLVIAGPDEGGHAKQIRNLIQRHGLNSSVELRGPAYGVSKHALFSGADLFVLPSLSENFGTVVLEALSYGIPVITTKATPWAELAREGCGWWIEVGSNPLRHALAEAFSLPEGERCRMGERGRALVERRYSRSKIAEDLMMMYSWVLHKGARPSFIGT